MNTMYDKCAVAGDITQAIDRRGCWSVAITVIGGTESTAVKLQSCETADGSYTDYKELIPASEASADQYKGYVVDLYGAGKFIKVVGATMATAVLGDCDHDVKSVAIKAGEVPSGADLEDNKTATIDVSAYTAPVEIIPTAGKDGMKKATITLSNIPSGGGTIKLYAFKNGNDVIYADLVFDEGELLGCRGIYLLFDNQSATIDYGGFTFNYEIGGNHTITYDNKTYAMYSEGNLYTQS